MNKLKLCLLFVFNTLIGFCQYNTILKDNLSDRTKLHDNTLLLLWGNNTDTMSCYETGYKTDNNGLTYRSIYFKDTALPWQNYHDTSIASTQAATCLDWEFGPLSRNVHDSIKIEFDILWQKVSGSGETGRINVMLLHEYPKGGAGFLQMDTLTLYHPFGRPTYHFRARNSTTVVDKGFTAYGGGNEKRGRLYRHDEYAGPDSLFWMPGAVNASSINTNGSAEFPDSINQKNFTTAIASSTRWKHVTWYLYPEKMDFYHRYSSDSLSGDGSLFATMDIPKTAPVNYPWFYHWFDTIEAFRFYCYYRNENVYFANLTISATGSPVTHQNKRENDNATIKIFPNPAYSTITVTSEEEMLSLVLYNLSGEKIFEQKATEQAVQIQSLSPGFYILQVKTRGKSFLRKIIIQ